MSSVIAENWNRRTIRKILARISLEALFGHSLKDYS